MLKYIYKTIIWILLLLGIFCALFYLVVLLKEVDIVFIILNIFSICCMSYYSFNYFFKGFFIVEFLKYFSFYFIAVYFYSIFCSLMLIGPKVSIEFYFLKFNAVFLLFFLVLLILCKNGVLIFIDEWLITKLSKISFCMHFITLNFELVCYFILIICSIMISCFLAAINLEFNEKPMKLMAGKDPITIFVAIGTLLTEIVELNPTSFFGIHKSIQLDSDKHHFQEGILRNIVLPNNKDSNMLGEAASKSYLLQKSIAINNIDIVPNKFMSNKTIIYPSSSTSLMPYVAKGGDILFFEDQKLIVTELKYRHVEFNCSKGALNYINKELIFKYKENLKPCSILVDCATESISKSLLNCIKQGGNGENFIFEDQAELKNISIQELEKLPTKSQFKHIVISDKSMFYDSVTEQHIKFNALCAEFLKNTDFTKSYNTAKSIAITKLQAGDFTVNKFVEDDIAFLKNLNYEKPEN